MYQRDLRFEVETWDKKTKKWVNKERYEGVGVIPFSEKYKVTLYAIGKVDMMTLTSCHREIKVASPKKSWYDKGHTFEFSPAKNIETDKPCLINLGLYEKSKGRNGWALIAIESSKTKLSAVTKCNGVTKVWKGASFCQAKKGLIQVIFFKKPTETTMYSNCKIQQSPDGKTWEYSIPKGKCILYFFDVNDERIEHVHYMYGYDTIPIRGVDGGSYDNPNWINEKNDKKHDDNPFPWDDY